MHMLWVMNLAAEGGQALALSLLVKFVAVLASCQEFVVSLGNLNARQV